MCIRDSPTTVEAIIEPCNPEPENLSLPEAAETTDEPEDNTDDYEQLKEEYLELLEDTKSQPKKNRKKLPKLKMNKNTKKLIRMVNRIIETTLTDDMNITNMNLMQYTGALLITNKITPAKPTTISFVDDLGAFFHILVDVHHSANHQKLNIIQN